MSMKLENYLKLIDKSPVVWAKEHKNLAISTVWRAFRGVGTPTLHTLKAIEEASQGAVKVEDW